MKYSGRLLVITILLIQGTACNYFTYTLRSQRVIQQSKPSVMIFSRIADYRMEMRCWPVSKEDFITKGKKYADVFEGFPYNYTWFKIKDSNTMTFYFADHIKDAAKYNETGLYDLNGLRGWVKFYKKDGRFTWKLKMK